MSVEHPLSAYRVLEIASGPGSLCGRILADLGASVVKVEPPGGDVMRTQAPLVEGVGVSFLWFNANKRLIRADMESPDGQRRIREEVGSFDLLLDGNDPGWLASHGLNPDELLQDFPELVITSVSHFGQTGPYRDWKGSSLVDFALAGSLLKCGLPDAAPCGPPYLLPYVIAGITAASASLAALWQRCRTGKGDWIDCSVIESVQAQADWTVPNYGITGHAVKRAGAGPLFRVFPADDGWVRVINLSSKQWKAVKDWLGNPSEISGPEWENPLYRATHLDIQDEVFTRHFTGRTKVELYIDGQRNGVGIVPIYSPMEVMEDAHFQDRGTFVPFKLPSGREVRAPGAFVRMGDRRPSSPLPPLDDPRGLDSLKGQREPLRPLNRPVGGPEPLSGLRVVEVGSGAVAPEICRLLGELGADVIKLESRNQLDFMRLQGSSIEASGGWSSSNRNKRSVQIDLKHSEGRRLGFTLASLADVIVENNTGGVMERLGIGYHAVASANPKVVYVSSQAFGSTGPGAGFGGFGPTNQAVSATSYLWNHPNPLRPEGVQVIHPDHLLGRMGALAAIAALTEVRRSGEGQHIDLGQAEFAIACIGEAFIESDFRSQSVESRGNESSIGAPHGVFPCSGDDQWIAITVESDEAWERLRKVVAEPTWEDPKLATVQGRLAERSLIEAQLGAWTSQLPAVQLMRLLQAENIAAGAAYAPVQVLADVHFAEREFFQTIIHPVLGAVRMEGVPFHSKRLNLMPTQRAPLFGEHTASILQEWLGLDGDEIVRLKEVGALT